MYYEFFLFSILSYIMACIQFKLLFSVVSELNAIVNVIFVYLRHELLLCLARLCMVWYGLFKGWILEIKAPLVKMQFRITRTDCKKLSPKLARQTSRLRSIESHIWDSMCTIGDFTRSLNSIWTRLRGPSVNKSVGRAR